MKLQVLCYIKEMKLSGFHWEITTLSFTPPLVNIHNADSYFLVDKVVNNSFSCY